MSQTKTKDGVSVKGGQQEAAQASPFQRRKFTIFRTFLRWSVLGIAMGLFAGAAGSGFHYALKLADSLRENLPWLLYFLPVAGILIVAIYRFFGRKHDRGTNLCILAVRDGTPIPLGQAVCIIFGTILTHLCGGSSGREGAALQIGGSVASFVGNKLKLDEEERRLMVLCGMSACFSALFGTPIAAAVFALEMISVGSFFYSALLPCVLSSLTAQLLSGALGNEATTITAALPALSVSKLALTVVLAVAAAGLSHAFCMITLYTGKLYKKAFRNSYLRVLVGGLLVVGITLLIGDQRFSGAGMELIERAFTIHSDWWIFILKLLLTALTLGAGFKGGEIIPALCVGATFGSAAAQLLTLSPALGAAVGMLAVFCGVTNCPIAAMLIGIEMFGADGLPFFGTAVAVSYLISGYTGLYSEQKILYSKVRPHYIDRRIGDRRPTTLSEKLRRTEDAEPEAAEK